MPVPARDDDPLHANFDGIVFYETTDKSGIVATPSTGQTKPPVSFLPLAAAVAAASDIYDVIDRIRGVDSKSYLADYLDNMLEDFSTAIRACRPESKT